MLIKPRVASIFIWKYAEALFRGLFSGVMVVEEWDLLPLGAPLVMKGISRTIREKREVLVRMSKSELLNHHQAFVVFVEECLCDGTKAATCRYWGHRSFMYCEQHPKSGSWCLYSSFLLLRREDLQWGFPWPANTVLAAFQCIRQLRELIIKPACHRFWSILS